MWANTVGVDTSLSMNRKKQQEKHEKKQQKKKQDKFVKMIFVSEIRSGEMAPECLIPAVMKR